MALKRQAKTLNRPNFDLVMKHVRMKRNGLRNEAILLLSVKAGLRAKEISDLTWTMILDPDGIVGDHIHLTDMASKGNSGRSIPLNRDLKQALTTLHQISVERGFPHAASRHIISTERCDRSTPQVIVNLFRRWYGEVGLIGCSSHSGRRTFITNAARKISTVGGSLRDVQALAGHKSLNTTQRYIEFDSLAQSKVVNII